MLDHITLIVSDIDKAKAFYTAALAPLGYEIIMELSREQIPSLPFEKSFGMGVAGKPDFWVRPAHGGETVTPTHIAFRAESRKAVDAFHAAALEAGGKDHGAPGPREMYHPNYYGGFVLDPDGYNIEAVIHTPE